MTNSNDRKNITGDDADDLIAELARIVADDAQRSNVAKSIDERAETNQKSFSEQPSFEERQPESNVEPFPAEQLEDVNTPEEPQTSFQPEPTFAPEPPAPDQTSPSSQDTDFDFDFSDSIQKGPSTAISARFDEQTTSDDALDSDVYEAAHQTTVPVEPEPIQDEPQADDLDGIASLIEEVERQSSQPEEPAFEPVPVAQSNVTPEHVEQEPAEQAQDFSYLPQQDLDVPAGEDEFAIPPSNDAEDQDYGEHDQVKDALAEIENLIADTKPSAPNQPQKAPADAAEAAILAALGAARAESGMQAKATPVAPAAAPSAPTTSTSSAPSISTAPAAAPSRTEPRFSASDAPTARDRVSDTPTVGTVAPEAPKKEPKQPKAAKRDIDDERRGDFKPVIAAVAAVLLLAIVGGLGYWMLTSQTSDGDVPIVSAQNTEVKQEPEPTETPAESTVFNALEGNQEDTGNEQLVPRDETVSTDGSNTPRVITPSSTSNGLTNRKVKTVTVLADGTIVTGDEASAGAEQLPSDVRPNVPTVSSEGTDSAQSDEITNVLNSIVEQTDTPTETASATDGETTDGETAPATDETATEVAATDDPAAPVPPVRPQGLGTNQPLASAVLATPQQTTPATNTSTQTEAPISLLPSSNSTNTATTANTNVSSEVQAPFYVQLSSQRSVEAAQSTAATLSRRFGSVLAGSQLDINRVNLGDRGIYYRVRVPASSLAEANSICSNIKTNGGDCFVYGN
jgi:hypothetical protein